MFLQSSGKQDGNSGLIPISTRMTRAHGLPKSMSEKGRFPVKNSYDSIAAEARPHSHDSHVSTNGSHMAHLSKRTTEGRGGQALTIGIDISSKEVLISLKYFRSLMHWQVVAAHCSTQLPDVGKVVALYLGLVHTKVRNLGIEFCAKQYVFHHQVTVDERDTVQVAHSASNVPHL